MSDTSSIPFDLNEDSVGDWLDSISSANSVNAGNQLNQAIKLLKKTDSEQDTILPILVKLTPVTLHLANALSTSIKPGPQQGKYAKVAKLSLQIVRNLSLAFHDLTEQETYSIEQKLHACYYALHLVGQYLRISSLFHELPSLTLWKKSGEMYAFAHENDGLRHNFSCKITEFRQQSSIEQVLKRNIVFTLTAFRQQSATDNLALFAFANQYSHLLTMDYDRKKNGGFLWNYKEGIPSQIAINAPIHSADIAIDTVELLAFLHASSFQPSISTHELERLNHILSSYQKLINDSIPSAPIIFKMLAGFKNVYDFLKQLEKLNRIYKLSSQMKDDTQNDSLSLEPMEHEKSLLTGFSKSMEQATGGGISESANTVKILQNKNKNFVHAETKKADFKIGDLVILANNKNAVIAGVVRQVKSIANTQLTMLLIERLYGHLTTHIVQTGPYKNAEIITINEESNRPEVLLSFHNYHNGTMIQINNKNLRLDSVIDYSPFFVRYQVGF